MKAEKLTEEELLQKRQDEYKVNSNYIHHWSGNDRCRYNIGDWYSNYLFNKLYSKELLDKIEDRKKLILIGTAYYEWYASGGLCCGLGLQYDVDKFKNNPYIIKGQNICYMRGQLSKQILIQQGVSISKSLPVGDNGLLANLLYQSPKPLKTKYDTGIILHWSQSRYQKEYLKKAKKILPGKKMKVFCMDDLNYGCEDLFDFILQCKVIVSCSLHGIIFAHSFGIPALYFNAADGCPKFRDYYSAYDRIDYMKNITNEISFDIALSKVDDEKFLSEVNPTSREVKQVQQNIFNALPYKTCFTELAVGIFESIGCNVSFMQNTNPSILFNSTSGGVVPALMEHMMRNGGHCFGVKFNDSFTALEYAEVNEGNFNQIQGAKYLDVEISSSILDNIRGYLSIGEKVLVVGRPCQCFMLRQQLRKCDNLILVEIMCGGVPKSNDLWIDYINNLKKEYGEVYQVNFNAKNKGWSNPHVLLEFMEGTLMLQKYSDNEYMNLYTKKENLNQKCIKCPFGVNISSVADIICGDAIGVDYISNVAEGGTSIVVVNTSKGRELMNEIKGGFTSIWSNKEEIAGLCAFNRGLHIM